MISISWGYSSVVEHLTADQEVPGSNPGAPCWVANFKTRLLLFIFCQTDFFSVDEDKIFRKSGPPFFHLDFGGFWKNQSPDFEVKVCCLMLSKWSMPNSWLKVLTSNQGRSRDYRFKSSCPLGLGILEHSKWGCWCCQNEVCNFLAFYFRVLDAWGIAPVVEALTTHEEVPSSNPGAPFVLVGILGYHNPDLEGKLMLFSV